MCVCKVRDAAANGDTTLLWSLDVGGYLRWKERVRSGVRWCPAGITCSATVDSYKDSVSGTRQWRAAAATFLINRVASDSYQLAQ